MIHQIRRAFDMAHANHFKSGQKPAAKTGCMIAELKNVQSKQAIKQ
jgi:hypothetical protein